MGALGQLRGAPGESWHKAGSSRAGSCCSHCGGASRAAGDTRGLGVPSHYAGARGAALHRAADARGTGRAMHQLLVRAACAGGAGSARASAHGTAAFVWHTVCVTGSQRHPCWKRPPRSSAPGTKLMCLHMCVSRACQCAQACAGCAPVCRAHARVGCKHMCVCRGVGMLCVHARVRAGLACRGCKVCRGCVRPAKCSGAPSPHESVGLRGGCSPLPWPQAA